MRGLASRKDSDVVGCAPTQFASSLGETTGPSLNPSTRSLTRLAETRTPNQIFRWQGS